MIMIDVYQDYLTAAAAFQRLAPPSGDPVLAYGLFGRDQRELVPFVDTGLFYPGENHQSGDPTMLKYFNAIRFGGEGKLFLRVMVDKTEKARGFVTLSEDPYQASLFRLPQGTAGYGLRLQMVGLAWWRYLEVMWEPVSPPSGSKP